MSLTQTNHVFAGIQESGVNTFISALLAARPRYANFGSPAFVPTTTIAATSVPAIDFPGVPGGIQYFLRFKNPIVDLFPPDGPGPLPPGPGELNLQADAELTLVCVKWTLNADGKPVFTSTPLITNVTVWAKGTPDVRFLGPGIGSVGFVLEEVLIPSLACVGGKPDTLEALVECLIRMILQAVLENFRLPFTAVTLAFFKLILQRGPLIDADQLKLWGDII